MGLSGEPNAPTRVSREMQGLEQCPGLLSSQPQTYCGGLVTTAMMPGLALVWVLVAPVSALVAGKQAAQATQRSHLAPTPEAMASPNSRRLGDPRNLQQWHRACRSHHGQWAQHHGQHKEAPNEVQPPTLEQPEYYSRGLEIEKLGYILPFPFLLPLLNEVTILDHLVWGRNSLLHMPQRDKEQHSSVLVQIHLLPSSRKKAEIQWGKFPPWPGRAW